MLFGLIEHKGVVSGQTLEIADCQLISSDVVPLCIVCQMLLENLIYSIDLINDVLLLICSQRLILYVGHQTASHTQIVESVADKVTCPALSKVI